MSIKSYAFRAHAHLKSCGAPSLTRSHTYELLAAAAGYSSHAAFQSDAVWCDVSWQQAGLQPDTARVHQRCMEFGLDESAASVATQGFTAFLLESGPVPARYDALLVAIEGDKDADGWPEWLSSYVVEPVVEDVSRLPRHYPILADGLESAGARGSAFAHYVIAKLLQSAEDIQQSRPYEEESDWLTRVGQWTSPFVSFAELASNPDQLSAKLRHHLFAAAELAYIPALEWTADRFDDPRILRLPPSEDMEPWRMALVAQDHQDGELVRHWLTVAARQGDVEAMRELIEVYDETGHQAWVWMHLSRLLGNEMSRDRHVAINEDGSEYDFDVGGPAYVGGDAGIELDRLSAQDDRIAREEAEALLAAIERARAE